MEVEPAVTRPSFLIVFCLWAALPFSAAAQKDKDKHALIPTKILRSDTVYIDCSACPRALANAGKTANQELRDWGRFHLVNDRRTADLVFLYGGNPYEGDYITRDGPDMRPVHIETTFMTIVDPKTGEGLWTDARKWGSLRVSAATKDLIEELRHQMQDQVKQWTLDQVMECYHTNAYINFAFETVDQALATGSAERVPNVPDRLIVTSPQAPEFCRRAGLIIGSDGKLKGYEVITYGDEALDVADILAKADQFNFASGKYTNSDQIYFSARKKESNVLIEFKEEGHRSVLARVTYPY
jgi:hypothetical protein